MKGLIALSPLAVFVTLYLVTSLVVGDFYKVPITVAFLFASIYAIAIARGQSLPERIKVFGRGAGAEGVMMMLWIFILAGAFANSAKELGCIDATVSAVLAILPSQWILAGMFLAACLISIAIGTSVGTIVALVPIAAGMATTTGTSTPLMTAIVVGGAFFGDNLSFISDTTVVATSSQGCRMSDKFRVNAFIVMPAAIAILIAYIVMGADIKASAQTPSVNLWLVIPYLAVFVTAVCGLNVMAALTLGIALTGIIGIVTGTTEFFEWLNSVGKGILSMSELIIISMMAGGLLEVVKENGGIDFAIRKVIAHVKGKRGAELSIAAMVALVDVCTANNTVAILTVGGIAKQIGDRFGVDKRKAASILDTFSCTMQGFLPYGAQLLMAAGLASISPTAIIPYLYYPMAIGLCALAAILFRYPRRYS